MTYKYDADKFRHAILLNRVVMLDLSLGEAADQIGISKATLSRVENRHKMDIDTFCAICTWLKISPDNFLSFTDNPA